MSEKKKAEKKRAANTKPPGGMRDFLPAASRRREYVMRVIREVYERYGFEPLETPACENLETLTGKYGEEGNQLIFKILRRGVHEQTGEADLALRYDLTVPLARVVAEYGERLPKFFKRYQIQPVWRADRPARGRFREFYQCDVDSIGSRSMVVEAEVFAAVDEVLRTLGFKDFTIRLNHRQVLAGVLAASGIPPDKHGEALVALDKLDKVGLSGVLTELSNRDIALPARTKFMGFFEDATSLENAARIVAEGIGEGENEAFNVAMLGRLVEFVGAHEEGARGVEELRKIIEYSAAYQSRSRIKLDPSLARGLSYYTGAIMEVNVPDLSGSLGGGGRYDKLVGMFSEGREVPACGFSVGLDRIVVVMEERGLFPASLSGAAADVMVTVWNEEAVADSLALAGELRAAGLRVDVYPEADKLGKQFKYASSRGVPFVAVVGDEEREGGRVAVKDMASGEQRTLPRDAETIKTMIRTTNSSSGKSSQ
jgi:histidyl-tRNA synthetase